MHGCAELEDGELMCDSAFSLQECMTSIELMDVKTDVYLSQHTTRTHVCLHTKYIYVFY